MHLWQYEIGIKLFNYSKLSKIWKYVTGLYPFLTRVHALCVIIPLQFTGDAVNST
jgi:hypothetical protein